MTRPKFKSDARPSDTKSVVLHKETDARLLDHLKTVKRESAFWRQAAYFYLDFMAWLTSEVTQPAAPEPGRPFVYYRAWLEECQRRPPGPGAPAVDPETLAAAVLPGVRAVVEAALSTALAGLPAPGPRPLAPEAVDLADYLISPELVLE